MSETHEDEDANRATWVPEVAKILLEQRLLVPLLDVITAHNAQHLLTASQLRSLCKGLRDQGYLHRALNAATLLASRSNENSNILNSLKSELSVLIGDANIDVASDHSYSPRKGTLLNVVGSSLPNIDSNYTQQTHALALLGARLGVDIAVCSQMGTVQCDSYHIDDLNGVRYYRIPGPSRGDLPFREWIGVYAKRLASVVRKARPEVLVAASDFVNASVCLAVAKAYNIPCVYDVRGFWEDSWLRRKRKEYLWSDDQVPERWGYPDTWTLRRKREADSLKNVSAVVTQTESLKRESISRGANEVCTYSRADYESEVHLWSTVLHELGVLDERATQLANVVFDGAKLTESFTNANRLPLGNVETFAKRGKPETIIQEGWRHAHLTPIMIDFPFNWVEACTDNRSQGFHLHAWDFMVPLLDAWEREKDLACLNWCLDRAFDWSKTFSDGNSHGTMAWYDMAIGLRAPRLAYLAQEAVAIGADSEYLDTLADAIVLHQRAIFSTKAFNSATNHGFYTAVGQLSFARRLISLPGMKLIFDQGEERLREVVSGQFASDGGHLEHSPDYHRMLVSSFLGAMDDGLLTDPETELRTKRAEEAMGWFLQPDRSIVQIGDSPARIAKPADRAMRAPHTRFLVSEGKEGVPNKRELMVLQESGYAFVRSPQPTGQDDHLSAGYLTLMAGFHSRAHKHCDDLSITWFDAGTEILIDAGRFGYLDQLPANSPQRQEGFFYGRPERQYVERTRAHNTIQADGREHDRRERSPYGSAIDSALKRGEVFELQGSVDHHSWRHTRKIHFYPGSWLLVVDDVESLDDRSHDYKLWWNLSESLSLVDVEGTSVEFSLPEDRKLFVSGEGNFGLLNPIKGGVDPLRGWRSTVDYDFQPSWSMGFSATGILQSSFTTLFSLDQRRDLSDVMRLPSNSGRPS